MSDTLSVIEFINWRKCMGIEPTYQLITGTLDLKSSAPRRHALNAPDEPAGYHVCGETGTEDRP